MPATKILVVGGADEPARCLVQFLRERGYLVRAAASAPDALNDLALWSPHAAIVDADLPDGDGMKTSVEITRRMPMCRVVLVSEPGELPGLPATGHAMEIVQKPVSPGLIVAVIAKLVESAFAGERRRVWRTMGPRTAVFLIRGKMREVAVTENVSACGIRAVSRSPWRLGESIVVELPKPRGPVSARVVYCLPLEGGRYVSGLAFTPCLPAA